MGDKFPAKYSIIQAAKRETCSNKLINATNFINLLYQTILLVLLDYNFYRIKWDQFGINKTNPIYKNKRYYPIDKYKWNLMSQSVDNVKIFMVKVFLVILLLIDDDQSFKIGSYY